jgi:hypothetical protein
MATEEKGKAKPVGADLILPLMGSAYAIYYIWSVHDFPFEAQVSGFALATLLCALVLIFLVRTGLGLAAGRYTLGLGDFFGPVESRTQRGLFLLLIVANILAAPYLGFTLTTFFFLFLSFWVVGVRPLRRAFVVAACSALAGWVFFIEILHSRFPPGPFERLVQAIF